MVSPDEIPYIDEKGRLLKNWTPTKISKISKIRPTCFLPIRYLFLKILCYETSSWFTGRPLKPSCMVICPRILRPVCGSDGKTYNNVCFLKAAKACDEKPDLSAVHPGACGIIKPSQPPKPSCMVICPRIHKPVCGTDRKTYNNVCLLEAAKVCHHKPDLSVAHAGSCIKINLQDMTQ